MKFLKEFFKINVIVLFFIVLSLLFDFRVCIIYNIFKIPCPGCGLSRAILLILKGDFLDAIKYNLMAPIIVALYAIVVIWNFVDYKLKKDTFKEWTNKYRKIIFIIALILVIIQWVINLNNSLLY